MLCKNIEGKAGKIHAQKRNDVVKYFYSGGWHKDAEQSKGMCTEDFTHIIAGSDGEVKHLNPEITFKCSLEKVPKIFADIVCINKILRPAILPPDKALPPDDKYQKGGCRKQCKSQRIIKKILSNTPLFRFHSIRLSLQDILKKV